MDLKGKTIEEVDLKVGQLISQLNVIDPLSIDIPKNKEVLLELLSIRSQLKDRFDSVFNIISSIEENIKNKSLPVGTYGAANPLKITQIKNNVINHKLVFDEIKKLGKDPIDYALADKDNELVKRLITAHPELVTKIAGSKRHSFG